MDMYRRIMEIGVTGKKFIYIHIYYKMILFVNLNNNYLYFPVKKETHIINTFLVTLTKHFNTIEGIGLIDSKLELCVLWRKLAWIWINCPYFQNYNYLVTLIKVICNMTMTEACKIKITFNINKND